MDIVLLAGRIFFAALFIGSAIGHLTKREAMAAYGKQMGLPAADLMVPLTGIQILAGALMVLFGIWADAGALLLALFLLPTAFVMHAFWKIDDPQAKQGEMVHFQKNLSLFGASLIAFYLFQQFGDSLDLMITGPLF